tara:strand:+ start:2747 stop:3238 length:492 start_codon:yes stop_codon:yes gene_type:complete
MRAIRLFIITAVIFLYGCGFHLAGSLKLNPKVQPILLESNDAQQALTRQFYVRCHHYDIPLAQNQGEANSKVLFEQESVMQQALTVRSDGEIAEYELLYRLDYAIHLPPFDEPAVRNSIQLRREYTDNPSQLLGKALEREMLIEDMRRDAINQILNALGTLAK